MRDALGARTLLSSSDPRHRRVGILMLYTGGTIGMQNTPRGYAPAPGYVLRASFDVDHGVQSRQRLVYATRDARTQLLGPTAGVVVAVPRPDAASVYDASLTFRSSYSLRHQGVRSAARLVEHVLRTSYARSFVRSLGCLIAAIADRRADHDLPRPSRTGNASRPTSTPATTTTMRSWCCMAPTPWATRRRPCRSCSRISPRPSSSPARRSRSPRCATMASTISWVP